MRKNLIQLIIYSAILVYFISCSSGDNTSYKILTKNDRKNIDSFCVCSNPYFMYWKNNLNRKDSANISIKLDSIGIVSNNFKACIEFLKKLNINKKNAKEFNDEMLEYVRVKYPECYDFLMDKDKKDK